MIKKAFKYIRIMLNPVAFERDRVKQIQKKDMQIEALQSKIERKDRKIEALQGKAKKKDRRIESCVQSCRKGEKVITVRDNNFTYMLDAVNIRDHARHFHELATNAGITRGKILEIGGVKDRRVMSYFKDFDYLNLNLENSQVLPTIIGDITECKAILDDQSFDLIFSKDTFEHIARPQDAAREIARLLKPRGLCYVVTVFAWRYHPVPTDYWRFSPEGLTFLFSELECIERNFDIFQRRDDDRGSYENNTDAVPVDELGGWRENWRVYYVGVKPGI